MGKKSAVKQNQKQTFLGLYIQGCIYVPVSALPEFLYSTKSPTLLWEVLSVLLLILQSFFVEINCFFDVTDFFFFFFGKWKELEEIWYNYLG